MIIFKNVNLILQCFLHCLFSSRGTLQSCQYQVWPMIYELLVRFWPMTSVQDCNGSRSMVFNLWVIDKCRDYGVTAILFLQWRMGLMNKEILVRVKYLESILIDSILAWLPLLLSVSIFINLSRDSLIQKWGFNPNIC